VKGGWYVVRTKPMSEYMAASALAENGHDLYFPRVVTPRPRKGHKDFPLFPGYLFVRRDDSDGLPSVRGMAGLIGWVQFEGVAPRLPDDIIGELRRRVERINLGGGDWRQFQPGEKVLVASGAMEGLAEVLEAPESPESRVRVLLEFMGRLVPAHVPWQDLHPIEVETLPTYSGRPSRRTRGNRRWIKGFGPRGIGGISTPSG